MPPDTRHGTPWVSRPLTCHRDGRACTYWCTHHRLSGGEVMCGDSRAALGVLDVETADAALVAALTAGTDRDEYRAATDADRKRRE
jgi:hypothetical protein